MRSQVPERGAHNPSMTPTTSRAGWDSSWSPDSRPAEGRAGLRQVFLIGWRWPETGALMPEPGSLSERANRARDLGQQLPFTTPA